MEAKAKISRQDLLDQILDESPDTMGALIVSVNRKGDNQLQFGISDGTADEQVFAIAKLIQSLENTHKSLKEYLINHVKNSVLH